MKKPQKKTRSEICAETFLKMRAVVPPEYEMFLDFVDEFSFKVKVRVREEVVDKINYHEMVAALDRKTLRTSS